MLGRRSQTAGSRCSGGFLSRGFWLQCACALCGSCSLLLNSTEKQCFSDNDCSERGLAGAMCVANLCLPLGSTKNGVTGVAVSGATNMSNAGVSGTSEHNVADMVTSTGGAGDIAVAGTVGSGGRVAVGGVGGESSVMAASAGAGGCSGSSCGGECSTDADCEPTRGVGATCSDSKCFAPQPQCDADGDCATRGPEYVGGRCADRQCLPNPKWRCDPPPMYAPTDMIDLIVSPIDALQLTLVPNVPFVACSKLDYTCSQPVVSGMTGMDGTGTIKVPAMFAGYIQQNQRSDYTPGMFFLPGPLPMDGKLRNFPIIPSTATGGLALALGAALDSTRGHIMLVAEDCMGTALAGIVFSSPQADSKTVQFYVRDQVPTNVMSAPDTPAEGDGGYLNLPAGTVLISAKDRKTGLDLATVTVLIRAGYISVSYIRPIARGSTVTGVVGH